MRIVHVTSSLNPAHGGPPAAIIGMATAQAGLGHQVRIVSPPTPDKLQQTNRRYEDFGNLSQLELRFVENPGAVDLLVGGRYRRIFEEAIGDADFVHIHGVWGPFLVVASRAVNRLSRPYCVTPHGMLTKWSLAHRRLKKSLGMLLGSRRMVQNARFIHTLGETEYDNTSQLGLRPAVRTISLGVHAHEFDPLPEGGSFYRQQPSLGQRPYVIFLSRLHPGKGLKILGEALSILAPQHSDLALVVVGPDSGAKAAFESQIAAAGLQDRVLMMGPLYGRSKIAALRDALCFCLPSEHEACSVAILESLICGVPVVISPECDRPEIEQFDAGRIVPRQPQAIAGAIEQMLTDRAMRERLSRNARELALSQFTWSRVAAALVAAYQSGAPSPPRAKKPDRAQPAHMVKPTAMMKLRWLPRRIARHTALSTLGWAYMRSGRYETLARTPRVQVLLFHHVPSDHLLRFKDVLRFFSGDNRFISYSEAVERIRTGKIDQPYMSVAFDDGFKSCLNAANAMSELGIFGCFFVNPASIELRDPVLIERFNRERLLGSSREFLYWRDLERLIDRGHEIGSHTVSHRDLALLSMAQVRSELQESFDVLNKRLGKVEHFAWPYGGFANITPAAAKAAFEIGYKSCASGVRGAHGPPAARTSRLCIRRDHYITRWPVSHIQYFLARNARQLLSGTTWPEGWDREICEGDNSASPNQQAAHASLP
ncbi:MAG: glycosyltransferase [Phycisphaerales bacterium]|nr:glycosyltransferase [Phycisphaerales bacterium]MCI0630669.1 glycosyltransferase [Phycisphaerales bacterium]